MREPIFVRPLSDDERKTLKAGLRSPDAFVLRRCQILLASAEGRTAYQIARTFGCHDQTVRNAIYKFNEEGLEGALSKGSRRPHTIHAAFDQEQAAKLKEMLHRSPREFGKPSGLPLDLGDGRRGELGGGPHQEQASKWRDHPGYLVEKVGGALAAGQALDHEPRSPVCSKKRRRDRLMDLAGRQSGWVVGFEDETWWSRTALPSALPSFLARLERGGEAPASGATLGRRRRSRS